MKTTVKLAKGRTSIPVLNMIYVKDGVAFSTDLDKWVYDDAPDGLESGLYHAEGFDRGIIVKSSIPVEDFPMPKPEDMGKFLGERILSREDFERLQWVSLAQSFETTRYYLNGINFVGQKAVATDGHRLHVGEFALEFPRNPGFPQGTILPRGTFKYFELLVKEHKGDRISIEFYERALILRVGKASINSKLVDGTFPTWELVVPKYKKQKGAAFNPEEIKAILPEIRTLAKIADRKESRSIILNGGTATFNPVAGTEKHWPISTNIKIRIGVNSELLADTCPGLLRHGDPTQPIVINGDDRMAVVMPISI